MTASRESQLLNIFENRLPEFYNTKDIRTNQVQMAVDIATFLHPSQKQKKILIVEAPVGTGKSLGALVPSLLECSMDRVFNPLRVVYATATINLQGQLMNSEVPLLEELGLVQNAILAKGKSHYYCHKETISNRRLKDSHLVSKLSKFYRDGLTGHRDEYENENGEVPNVLWDKVSLKASKRECERCNYYLACPSIQHRNRFLLPSNDLLITNHEQLIRSAINRLQEPPFPPIVPINPGIIVIDEAHHFLENFLSQTERSISIRSLTEIQKTSRFPHRLKDSFGRIINNISKILSDESESCESLQGRYPLATEIKDNLGKLSNILETAIDRVYFQSENRVAGHLDKEDDFLDRLEETLASVRNLLNEKQYVSWMTLDNLELSSIPVNFPTKFKEMIELLSKNNKIIVMSGTLTTNGDFTAFLNQWRLPKDSVETTSLTHSFQYEKQALIYVPSQLADPRKQDEFWFEDQLNHYEKLLTLTHGRTLLLSTSKAHMEQISERINEICMTLGVSFLKQEQGSVEQLTKQFKNDETSVLLGSGSFFSGFSIPGTSLVSVVFTRLPFPVPDDPYLKLIGAGFEDVFMAEVTIPYMMTKLNQGVGRLIRDIGDYGVITVLDPRVFDASYGELIRSDFEKKGYRFTRSLVEVENFISDKKQFGSQASYILYSRSQINISEVLKDFTYLRKDEVIKEKVYKPKKYKINEEQLQFAQEICKQRNVLLSTKPKFGEDLYKFLVNLYYETFSDISPVRDHFPFKNEDQKDSVIHFTGDASRTYKAKSCTHPAFGCTGDCSVHFKEGLESLILSTGGKLEAIREGNKHCWLIIEPKDKNDEIMEMCLALNEASISSDYQG